MCGVRRSAVAKLRQSFQTMVGQSTEKQTALLSGILNVPVEQLKSMNLPKWTSSALINSVVADSNTPSSDFARAGPHGLY